MARTKKRAVDKTLQQWLIPYLREKAIYWPQKTIARDRSKVQVQIGYYKNGKPEYRTLYKCAGCGDNFEKSETHADHIEPMIDPKTGFVDWNTLIARLFCPSEGYQILCLMCHTSKTNFENEERTEVRRKKKKSEDLY